MQSANNTTYIDRLARKNKRIYYYQVSTTFKRSHSHSSFQFIHLSLKIVMGKLKHSRAGPRKPSLPTSRTLIFTLFVTFIFLILFLILLSLRIPKPKHLNSITHINTLRFFFNSTTNISSFLLCFLFMTSFSHLFYAEVKTMTISVGLKSYRGSLEHFYIIIFWLVLPFFFH